MYYFFLNNRLRLTKLEKQVNISNGFMKLTVNYGLKPIKV